MANLYRLVLSLLFCLASTGAFAVTASPAGYAFPQSPTYGAQGPTQTTVDAACAWGFNQYKQTTSGHAMYNGWTSYAVAGAQCNMKVSSGAVVNNYSIVSVASVCPANSTGTAPTCVCKSGFVDKGTSCTADPQPTCDAMNATGHAYSAGTVLRRTACLGGVTITGSMAGMANGKNILWPPFTCEQTGCVAGSGAGSSAPTADPVANDSKCNPPQVGGTVTANGITTVVCYTPSEVTTPPKTTTAPTPAGSSSAPTSGVDPSAPAGATGGSKETTCTPTTCTTTTTYTGSGGGTVGTKTTTEPKTSFCSENPQSPMCEKSSIKGSCSALTCTGDAIQCAIAREISRRNCDLFDVGDTDAAKLFASSAAAAASAPFGAAQGAPDVTDLENAIKTNNALNVGPSCIADRQIQIMGKSMNVPLSQVCGYLDMLGTALVAVGMLAAAVIVFRG